MKKHNDISAHNEEIHFFDLFWYKGEDFLRKNQDYNKKIVLIKNPDLMYLSDTHWMIQKLNPFVKLIIFLRNPITRAYSSWQMISNNKWTTKTFEESIEEELKYRLGENKTFYTAQYEYLERGLYYRQIINLLKWFPLQNIKIMIIENFKNINDEYNKIYKFLDIDEINDITYTKERVNSYKESINKELYNKLITFYKKDHEYLEKLLGYNIPWFD